MDAVVDLVGGEAQERSLAILGPGGVLVSAVSQPDQDAADCRGVRARFMLVDVTTAALVEIGRLLDAGDCGRARSARSCRWIRPSARTGCSKGSRTGAARSC